MFGKLEHNLGACILDSIHVDSTWLRVSNEWGSINPSVRRKGWCMPIRTIASTSIPKTSNRYQVHSQTHGFAFANGSPKCTGLVAHMASTTVRPGCVVSEQIRHVIMGLGKNLECFYGGGRSDFLRLPVFSRNLHSYIRARRWTWGSIVHFGLANRFEAESIREAKMFGISPATRAGAVIWGIACVTCSSLLPTYHRTRIERKQED